MSLQSNDSGCYDSTSYIYISANKCWSAENCIKYGETSNLDKRLSNSHEQHPFLTSYIAAFFITEKNYESFEPINYSNKDDIITHVLKREKYIISLENKFGINLPNMREFSRGSYFIKGDGGREFVQDSQECVDLLTRIILEEFPLIGLETSQIPKDELDEINQRNYDRIKRMRKENKKRRKEGLDELVKKYVNPKEKPEGNLGFDERDYQKICIKECISRINRLNKVYLELATGGGKSYIVYQILKHYVPDIIVILSPLKKINEQNIQKSYLDILPEKYSILNVSNKTEREIGAFLSESGKKIIVACINSVDKLYQCIKDYNNIMIWFDEAHYGIENWICDDNKEDYNKSDCKKFWLENSNSINERIFVSASPNKKLVEDEINKKYFGELYNPISVSKLIEEKWLAPIEPYCSSQMKNDPNMLDYIIEYFKNQSRNWGFSFHSTQISAFSLFYDHVLKFMKGNTVIKPYLLVGIDFYDMVSKVVNNFSEILEYDLEKIKNLNNRFHKEDFYNRIKSSEEDIKKILNYKENDNILDEIRSPENDFKELLVVSKKYKIVNDFLKLIHFNYKDVKEYEQNKNSIGYVVQKYSMGYDFKNIDYIIFPDPKTSFKDIIQCIGRGTRPDKLGIDINGLKNGKNKDKILKFFLPIYYNLNGNSDKQHDFNNVIEVLGYLQHNYCMDLYDIVVRDLNHNGRNIEDKEDGSEKITAELINELHLRKLLKPVGLKELYKICIKNNIKNEKEYNLFKRKYSNKYRLKENIYDYTKFYWQKIIDPKGTIYYKTLNECNESKKNIFTNKENELSEEEYDLFYEDYEDDGWSEIKKYDDKIPPFRDLEKYYPS